MNEITNEIVRDVAIKNPMLGGFLAMGLQTIDKIKTQQEEWKERLLNEWEETKKMPRKMKKQRRKEILIDWSIANWCSPFNDYTF